MGKILIIKGADFSKVAITSVIPIITISESGDVVITCESATNIYYTTDGSIPTTSSTKYVDGFVVESGTTVKAIAEFSGGSVSSVVSKTYSLVSTWVDKSSLLSIGLTNKVITGTIPSNEEIASEEYGSYWYSSNVSNLQLSSGDNLFDLFDYIDVSSASKIKTTVWRTNTSTFGVSLVFYGESKNAIRRCTFHNMDATGHKECIFDVPDGAKYVRYSKRTKDGEAIDVKLYFMLK